MTPQEQRELELPVSEEAPLSQMFERPGRNNVLEFFLLLAKHKRFVLRIVVGAAVLSASLSLLLRNYYKGETRIMPPQQGQSFASAMLDQLGGLGSLISGGSGGSSLLRNPSDLYVAMLKSRTIADRLISRFSLMEVYKAKRLADARKALEANSVIAAGKEGVITIDVEDHDPKLAAKLANAYVEELESLTKTLTVSDAGKRRIFFEREAKTAQEQLEAAEQELKKTQEATGIIQIDNQSRVMFQAYADVRALATEKELELESMRTFAAPDNPEFIRIQHELAALRSQIAAMEKGQGGPPVGDIALERVPEKAIKYYDKLREVTYRGALLQLMLKQYEAARVDEAKDYALIQVLDAALPPERKSGPTRSLIVLATAFLAFLFAIAWVHSKEKLERAKEDPHFLERWQLLRFYLPSRGSRSKRRGD